LRLRFFHSRLKTAHTIVGDDMQKTIWESTPLPHFASLKEDLRTDVLVIGGGMAGILCARALTDAGVDCVLVEAGRLCSGVSGRTTAKLTVQHGPVYHKLLRRFGEEGAGAYLEANRRALRQYRRLCRNLDCGYEERDNYVYSRDDAMVLERELEALQRLHADADFVRSLPLPFPVKGAVRFRRQAQFHPLKFVSGILTGLKIYECTPVRELVGLTAVTDYVRIRAEKIIVATHFPFLNKHGSYFLKLYQQRSYVLALERAADVRGMYVDASGSGLSFRNTGDTLLLGGGGHRTGKQGGGFQELTAFAENYYPTAKEVCRWATQDCVSLDEAPYIGPYSARTPDLYVATGFNKWGMTSSMAAAMVLSDLVRGRKNPYAQVFSPSRSMLRPQLAVNGLESTLHLLKPTRPRCPHMGCALEWNPQERSWDCPCHGSRFSEEGKLLNNPATGGLKRKL